VGLHNRWCVYSTVQWIGGGSTIELNHPRRSKRSIVCILAIFDRDAVLSCIADTQLITHTGKLSDPRVWALLGSSKKIDCFNYTVDLLNLTYDT